MTPDPPSSGIPSVPSDGGGKAREAMGLWRAGSQGPGAFVMPPEEAAFQAGYLAARGSVSLPSDKVEVDAKMLDGANRAALSLAEQLESAEARLASLETALRDLLDWAEHIEGEGKFRRTEAIGQARSALSAAPSTGEDEEAAVERVAKALEELLSQHEAGYTFPPPGVVGQGDVRSEAWDAARAAIAAFRGVGEAK